jgi:hypothetical protein
VARKTSSPGAEKRRKKEIESGTTVDWRFESAKLFAPGILILYNVHTQKEYRIETKQGDSEILLVDGGHVYYRVSDEIFKAAIEEKIVGKPTLLAKGEMVPDIHWTFIGPSMENAPVADNASSEAKSKATVSDGNVEKFNWLDRFKEQTIRIGFVIAGVLLIGGGLAWGIFRYLLKRRGAK